MIIKENSCDQSMLFYIEKLHMEPSGEFESSSHCGLSKRYKFLKKCIGKMPGLAV